VWLEAVVDRVLNNWEGAACHGLDVNLFFPGIGENHKAKAAILVCSTCPIRARCLDYALQWSTRECPGIWGGTTEGHRARLRRHRVVDTRK
jgi:WhiB family redox-sensing transcriptional regulator